VASPPTTTTAIKDELRRKTINTRARLTYTCENVIAHENNYMKEYKRFRGKFVLMPKRLSEFV